MSDETIHTYIDIDGVAAEMRRNSERWFPELHADPVIPMWVFYGLGMSGEAGEVVNEVKKVCRTRADMSKEQLAKIGAELADTFTYLLLMVNELGIDIMAEYRAKVLVNDARWG